MAEETRTFKDYPVLFGETQIPFTNTWNESYNVIETVGSAEDGSDILQIKKTGKLSVSVGTRVTEAWANRFQKYAEDPELINVSIYDSDAEEYKTRTMRLRNFKKNKVPKSEDLAAFYGIWDCSFDLIETEWPANV